MADEKRRLRGDDADDKEKSDGFGTQKSGKDDFGALTGGGDSDLGNLPPLSDFESSAGGGFESGLPPLSSIDSDSDRASIGGLPPISDIPVETPVPTGGAIRPAPPGYGSTPDFGTPRSSSGLDTPSGTGFQDLSADSDFTPETPEVAPPGPESDIDTPLFDSAFGAGASVAGTPDTSAPTQAMETPMFSTDEGGFDADAFGGGAGAGVAFDEGTPVPDFGPDTTAPTTVTPPPSAAPGAGAPPRAARGGIRGILTAVVLALVAFAVGLVAGPRVPMVPNPAATDLEAAQATIVKKDQAIKELTARGVTTEIPLTQEEIDKLIAQKTELDAQVSDMTAQRDGVQADLNARQQERDEVLADIEQKNAEFVQAQADYEQLANETAITRARRDGLAAENERLENLVAKLEDANQRRTLTKETLESNVDQLAILIQEGSPLAPSKYSRESRTERVEALKTRVQAAKWVDPALLDEYTSLVLGELEIARSREYFFAKIPVADRFGTNTMSWAECLMNGNWSVYFRTLDGKHIGVYQNVAADGPPHYAFLDMKNDAAAKQVEAEIFASRTEGYEEKLEVLAKRQLVTEDKTALQQNFESM